MRRKDKEISDIAFTQFNYCSEVVVVGIISEIWLKTQL